MHLNASAMARVAIVRKWSADSDVYKLVHSPTGGITRAIPAETPVSASPYAMPAPPSAPGW
jgi:hypothetical protein